MRSGVGMDRAVGESLREKSSSGVRHTYGVVFLFGRALLQRRIFDRVFLVLSQSTHIVHDTNPEWEILRKITQYFCAILGTPGVPSTTPATTETGKIRTNVQRKRGFDQQNWSEQHGRKNDKGLCSGGLCWLGIVLVHETGLHVLQSPTYSSSRDIPRYF